MTFHRTVSARGTLFVAAISSAVVLSASIAHGQDALEPQGDFALTVSLIAATSGTPVAVGDGRMAMAVTQTAHLFNDAGAGGLLHFATGICASYQTIDFGANSIEITGYCNYRDADGDEAFEQFGTGGAVSLDAVAMTGSWIGGTGKYESLEGAVATELFASVQEGDAVLTGGRKTGSYIIANAIPEAPPEPPPPPPAADADAELFAALMDEGSTLFRRNCAGCHGSQGEGIAGPNFAGNSALSARSHVIGFIMDGNEAHGMPPWRDVFDDRQIAAVGTFIRNSWGNDFGIVVESAVATRR